MLGWVATNTQQTVGDMMEYQIGFTVIGVEGMHSELIHLEAHERYDLVVMEHKINQLLQQSSDSDQVVGKILYSISPKELPNY
jgi:hypothetical protein